MLNANSRLEVSFSILYCLFLSGIVPAEGHRAPLVGKPLDIQVQRPGDFGLVSAADIIAVLQSAASEIWRHCPRTQLGGIDVYHRNDHPQTDFKRTSAGRVKIGLATQHTYWAQYGFQFAHEFCHALANFSNNPQHVTRYPRNANLWLEESLCETASLFTLRGMSRSWLATPPYPKWRGYASSLRNYAENRLSLPEHQLPATIRFLLWFQDHQNAMRQNPAMRDRNTIVAIQLLPLFEAEPRGWEALPYLNRGFTEPNESLARHLAQWYSVCPTDLRPFVTRLARVFAVNCRRVKV
jgi:hypothetical protein